MAEFNITDIEIKRIIRIHNRFLKNKFEDRLESLVDVSNSNYKKAVEYLFYGIDPKAPQEIFRILEEGYRSSQVLVLLIKILIFNKGVSECGTLSLYTISQQHFGS